MSQEEKIVIPSDEEVAQYAGTDGAGKAGAGGETAEAAAADAAAPVPSREDWKDIALRARAELSNYQRRAEKDRTESLRYANASLLKALLPVLDDLERIVQTGSEAAANPKSDPAEMGKAVVDGARLTRDTFLKVFRDFNVEPIAAEGQPFDPQVHEAMMERPSDHAERTVLQELARGYRLHDRVLRPARVIVSKPSAP